PLSSRRLMSISRRRKLVRMRAEIGDGLLQVRSHSADGTVLFGRDDSQWSAIARQRVEVYGSVENVGWNAIGVSDVSDTHPRANGLITMATPIHCMPNRAHDKDAGESSYQQECDHDQPTAPAKSLH